MSANPGEPLYEFLHSNELDSVYRKFSQNSIDLELSHLVGIESSDLQRLCDELDLSVTQCIKFKKVVKLLNSDNTSSSSSNSGSNSSSSGSQVNNASQPLAVIPDSLVDYKLKIVLVGDSSTGKTSLIRQYLNNSFASDYISTIGIDFGKKTILTPDNLYVQLQIWDTCGQERFDSVSKQYFRGAHCVIVVYDITQSDTFDCIEKRWINTIQDSCDDATYVMLVGNKVDKRKVKGKMPNNNDDKMDGKHTPNNENHSQQSSNNNNEDDSSSRDDSRDESKEDDWVVTPVVETVEMKENTMVDSSEGIALAQKNNFQFCETSAKSGQHTSSLFFLCAMGALERKEALGLVNLKAQNANNHKYDEHQREGDEAKRINVGRKRQEGKRRGLLDSLCNCK